MSELGPNDRSFVGEEDDADEEALLWLSDRLDHGIFKMRRYAMVITLATLANLVLAIVAFFVGKAANKMDVDYDYTLEYASIFAVPYSIVLIGSLVSLWFFDATRNRADASFDELSELSQRKIANDIIKTGKEGIDSKFNVRQRVLIREYRLTRTLPFATGPGGPGLYVLLNVTLAVVAMIGLFIAPA